MIKIRYPVILASSSPRRKELLSKVIPSFEIVSAEVDETPLQGEEPHALAQRLAREKAFAVFGAYPDSLVIGADMIVVVPEDKTSSILNKPSTPEEAINMLEKLSSTEHLVITGVALRWPKGYEAFTETSYVTYQPIDLQAIEDYVGSGQAFDKAGGYNIKFIETIKGTLENLLGLPLERLKESLKQI